MPLSTAQDLIDKALLMLGVVDIEGTPTTGMRNVGLDLLNGIIDALHAERVPNYVYADEAINITDESTTWGPAADVTSTRPVKIIAARKVVGGLEFDLEVWDIQRYRADIMDKGRSGEPILVAYDPTYPVATLYAYPQGAYTLKVTSMKPWAAYPSLSAPLGLPPGYLQFLYCYLAVMMAPVFGVPPPETCVAATTKGRSDLAIINATAPRMDNQMAGYSMAYERR